MVNIFGDEVVCHFVSMFSINRRHIQPFSRRSHLDADADATSRIGSNAAAAEAPGAAVADDAAVTAGNGASNSNSDALYYPK